MKRWIPTMLATAFAAVVMAGCQTWGPTWSEVSGARYTRVALDRRPAILIRVGDESVGRAQQPFKVAPGTYRIEVQSPRHAHFTGTIKSLNVNVDPCERYYINAQFENPASPDWMPVIDYVESIPGCKRP